VNWASPPLSAAATLLPASRPGIASSWTVELALSNYWNAMRSEMSCIIFCNRSRRYSHNTHPGVHTLTRVKDLLSKFFTI
jgi:hypothetical protein